MTSGLALEEDDVTAADPEGSDFGDDVTVADPEGNDVTERPSGVETAASCEGPNCQGLIVEVACVPSAAGSRRGPGLGFVF